MEICSSLKRNLKRPSLTQRRHKIFLLDLEACEGLVGRCGLLVPLIQLLLKEALFATAKTRHEIGKVFPIVLQLLVILASL